MFEYDWKPEKIKESDGLGVEKIFKGVVVVKIPKHLDRIKALKDVNLKIENGEVVKGDAIEAYEKQIKFAIEHIKKVDLIRLEDELKFDSIEMLEHDSDGAVVLSAIGAELAQGVKLGKDSLKK